MISSASITPSVLQGTRRGGACSVEAAGVPGGRRQQTGSCLGPPGGRHAVASGAAAHGRITEHLVLLLERRQSPSCLLRPLLTRPPHPALPSWPCPMELFF